MLIALYFGLAFVVAIAAKNHRGRREAPWFFLSLIATPVLAGLLLMASKDRRSVAPAAKTCPQCAETVQAGARICRFCRHEFT